MSNPEVADRVSDIVAQSLRVSRTDVIPAASFITDLQADSLDIVELVIAIENEFGLDEIPDEEADRIRTVQDAIDYVVAHIS